MVLKKNIKITTQNICSFAKGNKKNKGNEPINLLSFLSDSWQTFLGVDFLQKIIDPVQQLLVKEYSKNVSIFPTQENIMKAFSFFAPSELKVVILGQDPYPTPGHATGLSFSVPANLPPNKLPSSLRNVFKELAANYNKPVKKAGDLTYWAEQGVLLLNTCLTVQSGNPQSHVTFGWQPFTDHVIQTIAKHSKNVVFVLWGKSAQEKMKLIDSNDGEHLVLKSAHPSGLSAHRGFFGSKPFIKINEYLEGNGVTPIEW